MLLALDVGNTNINAGLFKGDQLLQKFQLPTDKFAAKEDYHLKFSNILKAYNDSQIKRVLIASVVETVNKPLAAMFCGKFQIQPRFVKFSDIDLKTTLKNPAQTGIDRWINAYAAKKLYGVPVIVVDIGTATTFDVVDAKQVYKGGVIIPGVKLMLSSLYSLSASIPNIKIEASPKIIGDDTQSAVQSGLYWGYKGMLEGVLKQLSKELGSGVKIIFTGGGAELFSSSVEGAILKRNFTLEGIKLLS